MVSLLFACSPQNRLKRLLKNHPELVKIDTIFINDTTFITGVKLDTLIKWYSQTDTLRLINDRLTVKTFFNYRDTTVYIYGKCDADTIIKEIPITVQTVKPRHWLWNKLDQLTGVFVFIVVLYVLIRLAQSMFNFFKNNRNEF